MPKPNLSAHPTEVVKPDDFDQFWQEIMEEVDSIPLNASIELDSLRSSEEVEVFEVKYDSLDGLRIAGWYCLPRERDIPLPARVFYPGYISEPIRLTDVTWIENTCGKRYICLLYTSPSPRD